MEGVRDKFDLLDNETRSSYFAASLAALAAFISWRRSCPARGELQLQALYSQWERLSLDEMACFYADDPVQAVSKDPTFAALATVKTNSCV